MIADQLYDEDLKRINDRMKGMKLLTDLASFPPLKTTHFNENGTEVYKSKI
jgi:hypothetical protein